MAKHSTQGAPGKGERRQAIRPAEEKGRESEAMLRTLKALDACGARVQRELAPVLNQFFQKLSNDLAHELEGVQPAVDKTSLAQKQYEALLYRGRPVPELMKELEDRFIKDQAPLVQAMQLLINRYKGQTLNTFEDNHELASAVNRLARDYGIRLLYNNQPVTVRCVNAPRSRAGSFQVRRATAGAPIIHTSNVFPELRAAARASAVAALT